MPNPIKQYPRKHLLSLSELSKEDISKILDTSSSFSAVSERPIRTVPTHRGKTCCYVGATWDPSFIVAAQRLSAEVMYYGTDIDIFATPDGVLNHISKFSMLGIDLLAVSSPYSCASLFLSANLLSSHRNCHIVSYGDGYRRDPMNAVSYVSRIITRKGNIGNLRIGISGDFYYSAVAKSVAILLQKLITDQVKVYVCSDEHCLPSFAANNPRFSIDSNLKNFTDLDVLIVIGKSELSQADQIGHFSRRYWERNKITEAMMKSMNPNCSVINLGDMTRGLEMEDTAYWEYQKRRISTPFDTNITTFQAISYLLLAAKGASGKPALESPEYTLNSDYKGTDLSNQDLSNKDLSNCDLCFTRLSGCSLTDANLSNSLICFAEAQDVDFSGANLSGAYFLNSNLSKSFFNDTIMEESFIEKCILRSCKFHHSKLRCSNLSNSDLTDVEITNSDLSNCNLQNALLDYSRIKNSILKDVRLSGASIRGHEFQSNTYDENITLKQPPQGFLKLTIGKEHQMHCFKTGAESCPHDTSVNLQQVFIAMPFRQELMDSYNYGIRPTLKELGLFPWKADEEINNVDIMCKVCLGLQKSNYAIMNVSAWNPNVLFELGLSYGLNKGTILIKDKKSEVPADLRNIEYVEYANSEELHSKLLKSLEKLISS